MSESKRSYRCRRPCLIQPEEGEDRTVGLYLPSTAVDNQAVQGGKVVATGPGNAVSPPLNSTMSRGRLAARLGAEVRSFAGPNWDYALFFRKAR